MKTIVLISCVKQKRNRASKARDLYISSFFRKSFAYAHYLNPDKIFILSAKYGLVSPDRIIEPYELSLNTFKKNELIIWSEKTLQQLRHKADLESDRFIILAGNNYRKFLTPYMENYEIPMKGLKIGEQLQFLSDI